MATVRCSDCRRRLRVPPIRDPGTGLPYGPCCAERRGLTAPRRPRAVQPKRTTGPEQPSLLDHLETNNEGVMTMTDTKTIPTLTTTNEARTMLDRLAETHEWVSVFWDRGWGDSGQIAEISIIVGGNGQRPKAWITAEVYGDLRKLGVIQPNSLKTFKARRVHNFKTPPPPPPKTGPDQAEIAERVIRSVLADMPSVPIWVGFYRGLEPNSTTPIIREETVTTPGYDHGWHVKVKPGAADAVVTAWGNPNILGPDRIGDAEMVAYPKTDAGEVDEAELRARLAAAIEAKATALAEARSGESR